MSQVDECSICICNIESNEELYLCKCKNKFHKNCLGQWLENSNNCPLCRKQIPINKKNFS